MLPIRRPERALILGFGGGTLATLLRQKWWDLPIVGVDDTPSVVTKAAIQGWLPTVQLVFDDAILFDPAGFDYVAVDLFRGGEIEQRIFTSEFLGKLAGKSCAINMFTRHLVKHGATINEALPIRQRLMVHDNVIVVSRPSLVVREVEAR